MQSHDPPHQHAAGTHVLPGRPHSVLWVGAVALVSSNHGRNTEEEDDGDSMLKRGSASSWVGTGALDRDSPTNSSPAMERDGLEAYQSVG